MYKKYLNSPSVLIALGEALSKLATFIVIPVAGLILTTKDFNIWAIIFPSIQVLSTTVSFGLPTFLLRAYFTDGSNVKNVEKQTFISFYAIFFLASIIFFIISFFSKNNLFLRLDFFLIVMTNSFLLIIQQKYQAEKRGIAYLAQSLIWRNLLGLILLGLVILRIETSLDFLLHLLLLIQTVLVFFTFYKEHMSIPDKIEKDILVEIIKFGFPLFLIGILQFIVSINSRFLLYNKGVEADTAIFSIIQTFVSALNLLFVIFVRIYVPKLFCILNGTESIETAYQYKRIVAPLFEIFSISIIIALFGYSFFYQVDIEEKIFLLAPILIIGQFFYGMQIYVVDSMVYMGKTFHLLILNVIITLISTLLGFILVKRYGMFGGAISVAVTQFISLLLIYLGTRELFEKIVEYDFFLKKFMRVFLGLISLFIFFYFFGKNSLLFFLFLLLFVMIWNIRADLKMLKTIIN